MQPTPSLLPLPSSSPIFIPSRSTRLVTHARVLLSVLWLSWLAAGCPRARCWPTCCWLRALPPRRPRRRSRRRSSPPPASSGRRSSSSGGLPLLVRLLRLQAQEALVLDLVQEVVVAVLVLVVVMLVLVLVLVVVAALTRGRRTRSWGSTCLRRAY